MELHELITVAVFCNECNIELTLIEEFEEFGLLQIIEENGIKYINTNDLQYVQQIIHFHNELNINKEGIEVVLHLLEKVKQQQQVLKYLQDKLKLYE